MLKYSNLYRNLSEEEKLEKLEDISRDELSYLIDDGFEVYIEKMLAINNDIKVSFQLCKDYDNNFLWETVEDDVIKFLTILSTKYELLRWYGDGSPQIAFQYENNEYKLFDFDKLNNKKIKHKIQGIKIRLYV